MSKRWLNFFFRYSGFVFTLRKKIVESGVWYEALPSAVLLIIVETGFSLASIPLYVLVPP